MSSGTYIGVWVVLGVAVNVAGNNNNILEALKPIPASLSFSTKLDNAWIIAKGYSVQLFQSQDFSGTPKTIDNTNGQAGSSNGGFMVIQSTDTNYCFGVDGVGSVKVFYNNDEITWPDIF